jgi:high-affinity nickel permease
MKRFFAPYTETGALSLSCLLYRYLFFGWLFADLNKARNLFERHALWQHNRAMRKYLPTYLRRWAALFVLAFLFGLLCEEVLETTLLAACCYAGSCIAVPVMAVIIVAWLFLARVEMPWQR